MVKRIVTSVVVCAAALMLAAAPAEAQLCGGAPAFATAPLQVGTGLSFTDGAKAFGVGFAGGGQSAFAGVNFARTNLSDVGVSAKTLSGLVGGQMGSGRVAVCPIGELGYTWGPDLLLVNLKTLTGVGGLRVGVAANDSDVLMVVPSFGAGIVWERTTMTDIFDVTQNATDYYGIADAGVGLIFNRAVAVVPGISFPFATGFGTDVTFTLRFVVNFGG
ncbi:MAG TPA: hypothetical protein VH702_16835 [Vicinamibacterales bacterium]|jgi:hypothetical protein